MLVDREALQNTSDSCAPNDQNITLNPSNSIQSNAVENNEQNPRENIQNPTQSNDPTNSDKNAIISIENSKQLNDKEHDEIPVFELKNVDVVDPPTWPKSIVQRMRENIVDSVENLPDLNSGYSLPKSNGRSFSARLFYSTAPNQLKIKRSWLVYFIRSDSIFCFCCVLFDEQRLVTCTKKIISAPCMV